eukprot:scaffold895_cov315-Pinguiococcus_pyrenoidosus.AAC.34
MASTTLRTSWIHPDGTKMQSPSACHTTKKCAFDNCGNSSVLTSVPGSQGCTWRQGCASAAETEPKHDESALHLATREVLALQWIGKMFHGAVHQIAPRGVQEESSLIRREEQPALDSSHVAAPAVAIVDVGMHRREGPRWTGIHEAEIVFHVRSRPP